MRYIVALCALLLVGCATSQAQVKPVTDATPAAKSTLSSSDVVSEQPASRSLRDRINTDIDAAIIDASAVVNRASPECVAALASPGVTALPDHCAPAFYASRRLVCWRDIKALASSIPVIDADVMHPPAGMFDAFELGAQRVEDVTDITDTGLPDGMRAVLNVDCGWIGQRAVTIFNKMGARLVRFGASVGLVPK